jgi:hypothetical protein
MSGQRRVSFVTGSLPFPSNSHTLICPQPLMIKRQNEIPAHLPARRPSIVARTRLLRVRARFLSRDCGIGMIRQPTDSQRLDEARRQSLEVIAGGADPALAEPPTQAMRATPGVRQFPGQAHMQGSACATHRRWRRIHWDN